MGGEAVTDKLTYALAWAERGFRVFPLRRGSKKPAIKDWDWRVGASNDLKTVADWWRDGRSWNIGVLAENLIVLDPDVKRGKRGIESLLSLDLDFADLDTLTVRTPSGGKHLYYAGPNRSLSAGRLPPDIDVRSGNGYVIAPGSWLDPELPENEGIGGFYVLENDAPVRRVPTEVLARLDEPLERQGQAALTELDQPAAVDRAVAFLQTEAPLAVEGEGGDLATFKVAATLKDYGVSADMAVDLLAEHWNDRCSPPWDVEALKTKVANAYAYGARAPGVYSPDVEFAGVSIPPMPSKPVTDQFWHRHGDGFDPNTRWLYYDLLPVRGVCLLTAPSQAGKTFVALDLARSLATGRGWFGVEPDERGGTIFLFAGTEGSGLAQRLAALEEPEPLPISATRVSNLRERDALKTLAEAIQAEAANMKAVHGVPLRMVVLETLSASGLLEDEDSNAEAAMAMANLGQLSEMLGVLVVTSHHPPKGGTGTRGASAIPNNADYVLEIGRIGRETVRTIELTKARDAAQRRLGSFSLLEVELGRDDRGRRIVSMKVDGSVASAAQAKKATYAELFLECLDWALIDDGEEVEGAMMVEEASVADTFKERCPIKDRSNRHKQFKAAWQLAEEMGVVETAAREGKKYLRRRNP